MHRTYPTVFLLIAMELSFVAYSMKNLAHASVQATEQLRFSAEDTGVKNPVSIPSDVMIILAKDPMVQNSLNNKRISVDRLPHSWFSASIAHLGSAKRQDLIVEAEPPLAGGNTVTFWIFLAKPRGYHLALTIHAHDLVATDTYWKGYRELEVPGATSSGVFVAHFRYDGAKYEAFKGKSARGK